MKWEVPHPHMVVEYQEKEYGFRGLSNGMRGPSPTLGFPSPGFQSQKEEFLQNLNVKINGDSGHLGERKGI